MKHKAEAKKVDYAAVVYIYFNNSTKYAFQKTRVKVNRTIKQRPL